MPNADIVIIKTNFVSFSMIKCEKVRTIYKRITFDNTTVGFQGIQRAKTEFLNEYLAPLARNCFPFGV